MPFGDDPISDPSDDLLDRASLAEALSAEIAALKAQHGAVVAITGPWGSGKTSLMNLTAARLRNDPGVFGVVEFNPWLFSGAEQLAENLLSELAVQLRDQESKKDRARRVASSVTEKLLSYSGALSFLRVVPVASEFYKGAEETLKGAGAVLRGDQSLQQRRQDAIEALSDLDGRVVVLVDATGLHGRRPVTFFAPSGCPLRSQT
jgi:predicted KAP-like P-loop ATPase